MDPIFTNALLIDEITKRIAIWDVTTNAFYNDAMKRTAWREVVEVFSRPGDSIQTKRKMESYLRCKWTLERSKFTNEVKRTVTICNVVSKTHSMDIEEPLNEFESDSANESHAECDSERESVSDNEWVRRLREMILGDSEMGDGYVRLGFRRNPANRAQEDIKRAQVLEWRDKQKRNYRNYHQSNRFRQQNQPNFRATQRLPFQRHPPQAINTFIVPLGVYQGHYFCPSGLIYVLFHPIHKNIGNFNFVAPRPAKRQADALANGPRYQRDPLIGGNCGIQYNMFNGSTQFNN